MHNVVKWSNILLKSCGVRTARFLKCVWPFYNMHERLNKTTDLKNVVNDTGNLNVILVLTLFEVLYCK